MAASSLSRVAPTRPANKPRSSFVHTLASLIFTLSVLAAMAAFGYKFYLGQSIERMGTDLEAARTSLQLETVNEILRLNARIKATESLVSSHVVMTPLFEFLEASTPREVRFSNFNYTTSQEGLTLSMRGEARSYAALAVLANVLDESGQFKSSVFSNLSLNEWGDVAFDLNAVVDPRMVSYTNTLR